MELKVSQAAFVLVVSEACQTSTTSAQVVFKSVAPSPLDKQRATCNLPHDWLMSLAMDVAPLCDIWR